MDYPPKEWPLYRGGRYYNVVLLKRFIMLIGKAKLACVASVSVRFWSKQQGIRVKDRAKNGGLARSRDQNQKSCSSVFLCFGNQMETLTTQATAKPTSSTVQPLLNSHLGSRRKWPLLYWQVLPTSDVLFILLHCSFACSSAFSLSLCLLCNILGLVF